MSWLSEYYEKRFKVKVRAWLRGRGVEDVLSHPAFVALLAGLSPEAQAEARTAVALVFDLIADKWFGG